MRTNFCHATVLGKLRHSLVVVIDFLHTCISKLGKWQSTLKFLKLSWLFKNIGLLERNWLVEMLYTSLSRSRSYRNTAYNHTTEIAKINHFDYATFFKTSSLLQLLLSIVMETSHFDVSSNVGHLPANFDVTRNSLH